MPAAVILAAGLGTRMKSSLPKAMHPLAGRPMLNHLIASCEQVFDEVVVVLGPGMEVVERAAAPHRCALQRDRLGTAHAALQAATALKGYAGDVAVLYGDNPLIRPETMRRLLAARDEAAICLLAMRPADPAKYGRVLPHADGGIARIVEYKDATPAERTVGLCNMGVVCAAGSDLFRWLRGLRNDNASGEYYLGDAIMAARAEGSRAVAIEAPEEECRGVNDRVELAQAEAVVQADLRRRAMANGATLIRPESVTFHHDTVLGQDVTVQPDVVFGPKVIVEDDVEIRAFSHLEGCTVRRGATIGPFARLRPGTVVHCGAHVGNFVELKNAILGEGAKANHLTYLGDTTIGPCANIGAGTITCNYDGALKHRTEIGEGAFIGSNSALVAPVRIGARALVAAGSVITQDLPDDSLGLARERQVTKAGRGLSSPSRASSPDSDRSRARLVRSQEDTDAST